MSIQPVVRCFCFSRTLAQQSFQDDEDSPRSENVRMFPHKELVKATDNFSLSNKVGEGGFGSVYRGRLKDGRVVAIKVLSLESRQGTREFLTELSVLSRAVHENLVSIYGCCIEENHRILVYDFLENRSLSQALFGGGRRSSQFSWKIRSEICIDVARGLAFLHEEVRPHIVHRDIKASNILLDKDLKAKISDFGLAKLLPPNTSHVSTRVAGTIGYLAPEYAIRGQVTRKSDVYSFGVLLLEIVSGQRNTNIKLPHGNQFLLGGVGEVMHGALVSHTWELYEQGELARIIDTSLKGDLDVEETCKFLKVGLLCTQDASKLRPSMSTVLAMLTGKKDVDAEMITEPGLISDFMNLKIRNQIKTDRQSASYTSSSGNLRSESRKGLISQTTPSCRPS